MVCRYFLIIVFLLFRKPVDIAKILSRIDEDKYDDLDMMEKVGRRTASIKNLNIILSGCEVTVTVRTYRYLAVNWILDPG
jgi:hypothetical protein